LLTTPGSYLMTDHRTAYIGESRRPSRRLAKHAADPTKTFARDVFVVDGCDGAPFDKLIAVDLQFRLTRRALETDAVTVSKGLNPAEPDLTEADRSTHDRIFGDALRLLYDAGCRFFCPTEDTAFALKAEPFSTDDMTDIADAGPMEIGVTTTPLGAEQFELNYDDVWARGYWSAGHFIVAAGSEVRTQTNGSVNGVTRARRDELFRSGVLSSRCGSTPPHRGRCIPVNLNRGESHLRRAHGRSLDTADPLARRGPGSLGRLYEPCRPHRFDRACYLSNRQSR
jgi:hypothetical protein